MESELFPIPSGVRAKSMKLVCLDRKATEKLFDLWPTLMLVRPFETSTCLRNPSQCCGTSSGCLWTRIQCYSTPLVAVEVHCERLSLLVQNMFLDSKIIPSSPTSPEPPSTVPDSFVGQKK